MEIKAGPKLNQAVAKAVGDPYPGAHDWEATGLADFACNVYQCKNCGDLALEDSLSSIDSNDPCVKFYSTDLNAAIEAAEKVVAQTWDEDQRSWDLSPYIGRDERGWTCSLGCNEDRVFASTPALAICAAILKLKED